MDDEILEEYKKIVSDIYEQGYILGFGTDRDKWVTVYARAMMQISQGAEFTDKLIFECDDAIPKNMNEVH